MTDLSASAYIQLIIAGICAIVAFLGSYLGLARTILFILVATIPFDLISSRYGSLNVGIIYLLGASVYLNRRIPRSRHNDYRAIWFGVGVLVFAYALAFLWNQKPITMLKATYLIGLGSNVAMFYLVSVFVKTEEDVHAFFKALLVCNILVLGYCCLQILAEFTRIVPFGIQEFAFTKNRMTGAEGANRRLMGPFLGPGILAEFFVLVTYVLLYYRLTTKRFPRLIPLVVFGNMCALIATGNRGGFLVLIAGFFLFALVFKKMVPFRTVMVIGVLGLLFLGGASYITYKYTTFNVLYGRLAETEVSGAVPDTRKGWPEYIEEVTNVSPVFGTGVRLLLLGDIVDERTGKMKSNAPLDKVRGYPHSLYIYVYFTMGVVGLVAYAIFYLILVGYVRRPRYDYPDDPLMSNMHRLALFVLAVFAVDQFKIEFLRHSYVDYQNFITALVSFFLAARNIPPRGSRSPGTAGDETAPLDTSRSIP